MSLAFGLDGRILIIEKTENKGENCSLLGRKSLQLLHMSEKNSNFAAESCKENKTSIEL